MDRAALERAMQVAVDGIRTALLYSRRASQVVLVTSATGQEGRSTVASQLAVSMARAGKRTLLVDGDLRNPQQHLVFGVDARAGLCEMLRGQIAAEQAVVPTVAENVWLLTAGRCDQTALQGLSGEQASRIFQGFREQYDVVIMDSSPVLTSADALLLGQHADAALLSVRRDVSQLPKVAAACDRLTSVGVHVLGAVVNGADVELRRGELNVDEETNVEQPALINA
jgi:capsular exopolysaccharide synthesis family protein